MRGGDQHGYAAVEVDEHAHPEGPQASGQYGSLDQWKFTEQGSVKQLSRDGSVHVTDEVFNSASHLMAAMFSILGTAILVSGASAQGAPWKIVSFAIYGLSLVSLFAASTLHHSIDSSPRVEETLRMVDYLAIYPLIAGTLTPLCLVFFHGTTLGWSFFGVAWALAITGMVLTATHFRKVPKWWSMTFYVTLGWLGAFLSIPLYAKVHSGGLSLLALGGVFYTVGGVVFSVETPNPVPGKFGFHEIWHIFVILGAALHWCLMFLYVLPWHYSPASGGG
uniref:Hemolysin III n=1 Tax=Rhizochromulina marina TaxID=1034831 RepID=A0A6U1CTS6_9STRA|mmetsp:Transcript_6495/g.19044  ORF Transcript_6495/g.19044 Transcript_6495/m.19044 type:complete len:278 (+) Transcript_6495:133-966(+)